MEWKCWQCEAPLCRKCAKMYQIPENIHVEGKKATEASLPYEPHELDVARALHHDDTANDNMTVLTQAFAGAAGDPVMGPKLYAALAEWSEVIARQHELGPAAHVAVDLRGRVMPVQPHLMGGGARRSGRT